MLTYGCYNDINTHYRVWNQVKEVENLAKKKCDYCGEYYEEEYEGTLDNGSPACPHCVADEEAEEERKRKEELEK